MFEIEQRVQISVFRDEPNFDRACDNAYKQAIIKFGLDASGYFTRVRDSCRSTDTINVLFVSYHHGASMTGHVCTYIFFAWVSRESE